MGEKVEPMLHVLQHALGRDRYGKNTKWREDYRNHYCAGPGHHSFDACRDAVARGLMTERQPSQLCGGDHVFSVTEAGKAYIVEKSPPEPKLARGQRRYREWLGSGAADCGVSFGEWLRGAARKSA